MWKRVNSTWENRVSLHSIDSSVVAQGHFHIEMTCFHMEMTPSRVAMGRRRLSASGSQFASAQSDMGTAETHTTGQQSRQGLRRNSAVSRQRHMDSRRIPLDRYKDVSTTMIYYHVLNRGWAGGRQGYFCTPRPAPRDRPQG